MQETGATTLQLLGAGAFGVVIGWYVYFVNRYRADAVRAKDVLAIVSALGGAAVLALFPAETDLFAAYAIGLVIGFFGYFLTLLAFVLASDEFDVNWFLDGRRKALERNQTADAGGGRAMDAGERD